MWKHSLTAMVIVLVLDGIWLSLQKKQYNDMVRNVQGEDLVVRYTGAIPAYLFMFLGLLWIIFPSIAHDKTTQNVVMLTLKHASTFGLVTYGIFNATNYAIFKSYPVSTALLDTVWGVIVFSVATVATLSILGRPSQ
jgi:uncharacterized membrane protein